MIVWKPWSATGSSCQYGGTFPTCNPRPRDGTGCLTCFDSWYLNQPAMATVQGNGTFHVFISNTCICAPTTTTPRGATSPRAPGTSGVPPSTVLPASLKTVSVTAKLLKRDLLPGSRYHSYLALYYHLPNGPVTVGSASYQCFDTQVRYRTQTAQTRQWGEVIPTTQEIPSDMTVSHWH